LNPAIQIPCSFQFTAHRRHRPVVLVVPAKLNAGAKGISFESAAPDFPLHFELTVPWTKPGESITARFVLRTLYEAWADRDLLSVPFRVPVIPFVDAVSHDAPVSIRVATLDGRFVAIVPKSKDRFEGLKPFAWWFMMIGDGARIAERYGLRPKIMAPSVVKDPMFSRMSFALDTLKGRVVRREYLDFTPRDRTPSNEAIFTALADHGETFGWIRAKFPCLIEAFDAQRVIGVMEIEPIYCRFTAPPASPDPAFRSFRITRHPSGPIELRVRMDKDVVAAPSEPDLGTFDVQLGPG
jgi:hypothetical protein